MENDVSHQTFAFFYPDGVQEFPVSSLHQGVKHGVESLPCKLRDTHLSGLYYRNSWKRNKLLWNKGISLIQILK